MMNPAEAKVRREDFVPPADPLTLDQVAKYAEELAERQLPIGQGGGGNSEEQVVYNPIYEEI